MSALSLEEPIKAQSPAKDRGVTPRVVIFSLLLAAILGYFIPIIDYKFMNTFLGATHLPPGAVGALLVLVLVINPLLGVVSKKLKFTRNEALTVYISCLFSCLVPGHGAENFVVPNMVAPFYFATRENKWLEAISPYLKPWLTPALNADGTPRKEILDGWYLGSPQGVPWEAWIAPLLIWGVLILAIYTMLACLSVMLRAQWAGREAIAFPLLKLPLELTQDMESGPNKPKFFRNGSMWVGFGLVVFIQMLRGLNLYFPDVPTFPLDLELNSYFRDAPWNQLGWMPLRTYPLAVGIAFLLTAEVSFSMWFFFWFIKLQYIGLYLSGYPAGLLPKASQAVPSGSFLGYQSVGCVLVFVALLAWIGREHFGHVARRAFGRRRADDEERREVMSYPAAFWGFFGALFVAVGWTMAAGVRADVALVLWGIYLIYAIGLSRVAAEGGVLSLINDSAPLGLVARLTGSTPGAWLNEASGLVPASVIQGVFAVHMRGFLMPSFLHAFKLAHDREISPKPLLWLIAATTLISASIGMVMAVKIGYENGGLSFPNKFWSNAGASWAPAVFIASTNATTDNQPFWNWASLSFGGGFTYLMMMMRSRFAWFPLHPIGYLMAQTYPGVMFWFSFFIGWACKVLILRFGGSDSYKRAVPFFLGLAFGDVAMMLFWLAVDGWNGRVTHALLPS